MLFEKGGITSQSPLKLNKFPKIQDGQVIEIEISEPEPTPSEALPENIPLEICYEDEHLVIINKPAGMVVHPAPGNYTGTLVNAILHHCPDIKGVGGVQRPGIVHRLDKGTSGVMVVAKDHKTHESLVNLFSVHDIQRVYWALSLYKGLSKQGKIETLINRHPKNRLKMSSRVRDGKEAKTFYQVLKSQEDLHLFQIKLETGRTHQIRVHFAESLKAPLLNDELYGNPKQHLLRVPSNIGNFFKDYDHPFLHAKILGFNHPVTGKNIKIEADPPEPFSNILKIMNEPTESK